MRWMHVRFRAPLMAFGDVVIDDRGGTRDFPGQSMMVGLFANALGWTRAMHQEHQDLQDRLIFAGVHEHPLRRVTDYQTAKLYQDDRSWSTRGMPIGRKRSRSYKSRDEVGVWLTAQRWRDFAMDFSVSVVVRLDPVESDPTLDAVAAALERPARPLFIGRKSCLPSDTLLRGWVDALDARAALRKVMPAGAVGLPALWPATEGVEGATLTVDVTDERDWVNGLHGGARRVCEGRLSAAGDSAWPT